MNEQARVRRGAGARLTGGLIAAVGVACLNLLPGFVLADAPRNAGALAYLLAAIGFVGCSAGIVLVVHGAALFAPDDA